MTFVMAGGGTGGHVIPSIAVARELVAAGHSAIFVGTQRGAEATLVPRAGFAIEWIRIGGLQRVGWRRALTSVAQLPLSVMTALRLLRRHSAAAVFSMGGYAAAPVMLAAIVARVPIVVMEPNAMPGLVTRRLNRFVRKALLCWPETSKWFPAGRVEITGLPVREEFFAIPEKRLERPATLLVTGGSRGASALNRAARESWPLFRDHSYPVRFILQCGPAEYESLASEFNQSGLDGGVFPFIHDMPAAYSQADIVVSRSGAGAVAEIAASGRPSILVPFPHATDDHQRFNAEELARIGGARIVNDRDFSGERLFHIVSGLIREPDELISMGRASRRASRAGAARRAAQCLIELAVQR